MWESLPKGHSKRLPPMNLEILHSILITSAIWGSSYKHIKLVVSCTSCSIPLIVPLANEENASWCLWLLMTTYLFHQTIRQFRNQLKLPSVSSWKSCEKHPSEQQCISWFRYAARFMTFLQILSCFCDRQQVSIDSQARYYFQVKWRI